MARLMFSQPTTCAIIGYKDPSSLKTYGRLGNMYPNEFLEAFQETKDDGISLSIQFKDGSCMTNIW
jgi:hypothetical protein